MTKLPKFTEVQDPTIKSIISILDMIRLGSTLGSVKSLASLKGFDSIAKARTFKSAKSAAMIELKNNGLVII